MSGLSVTGGSAGVQSDLWGARAREWCAMEAQMRPLYEAALERVGLGHGTELLDAGLAAQLAAQRGAVVSGARCWRSAPRVASWPTSAASVGYACPEQRSTTFFCSPRAARNRAGGRGESGKSLHAPT
jgi:hypothetical protein